MLKKYSMQLSISAKGSTPGVRATLAESGCLSKDDSGAKPVDSWDWRWFSRSSERTFARLPLGPFFWGMALYVQARPAETQFLQAVEPSPMHLTLRRWQLRA